MDSDGEQKNANLTHGKIVLPRRFRSQNKQTTNRTSQLFIIIHQIHTPKYFTSCSKIYSTKKKKKMSGKIKQI